MKKRRSVRKLNETFFQNFIGWPFHSDQRPGYHKKRRGFFQGHYSFGRRKGKKLRSELSAVGASESIDMGSTAALQLLSQGGNSIIRKFHHEG